MQQTDMTPYERSLVNQASFLCSGMYESQGDHARLDEREEFPLFEHGHRLVRLSISTADFHHPKLAFVKSETIERVPADFAAPRLFLVVRGTQSWKDVLTAWTSKKELACFHGGFSHFANRIPLAFCKTSLQTDPNLRLVICGHSLGGAVAAIFAKRLFDCLHEIGYQNVFDRVRCITFGTPLFAMEWYARMWADLPIANHFIMIAHERDIVPRILKTIYVVAERTAADAMHSIEPLIKAAAMLLTECSEWHIDVLFGALKPLLKTIGSSLQLLPVPEFASWGRYFFISRGVDGSLTVTRASTEAAEERLNVPIENRTIVSAYSVQAHSMRFYNQALRTRGLGGARGRLIPFDPPLIEDVCECMVGFIPNDPSTLIMSTGMKTQWLYAVEWTLNGHTRTENDWQHNHTEDITRTENVFLHKREGDVIAFDIPSDIADLPLPVGSSVRWRLFDVFSGVSSVNVTVRAPDVNFTDVPYLLRAAFHLCTVINENRHEHVNSLQQVLLSIFDDLPIECIPATYASFSRDTLQGVTGRPLRDWLRALAMDLEVTPNEYVSGHGAKCVRSLLERADGGGVISQPAMQMIASVPIEQTVPTSREAPAAEMWGTVATEFNQRTLTRTFFLPFVKRCLSSCRHQPSARFRERKRQLHESVAHNRNHGEGATMDVGSNLSAILIEQRGFVCLLDGFLSSDLCVGEVRSSVSAAANGFLSVFATPVTFFRSIADLERAAADVQEMWNNVAISSARVDGYEKTLRFIASTFAVNSTGLIHEVEQKVMEAAGRLGLRHNQQMDEIEHLLGNEERRTVGRIGAIHSSFLWIVAFLLKLVLCVHQIRALLNGPAIRNIAPVSEFTATPTQEQLLGFANPDRLIR